MTYSIVAMDRESGLMGVGVQSHYFSVGSVVPWVEPGWGAVATQAMVEASYGPRGLGLMSLGHSSRRALDILLAEDALRDVRQVAFLDTSGVAVAHTGPSCIPEAGHVVDDCFSCQANMMRNEGVPEAMAEAFTQSRGEDLGQRMLRSLRAAEAAGGDIRGRQSAALAICRIERSDRPWQDRLVDIRVEDCAEPLNELERLMRLSNAYRMADRGEELMGKGDADEAFRYYEMASDICPDNTEISFWRAVTLVQAGKEEEAIGLLRPIFIEGPQWRELFVRLGTCGIVEPAEAEAFLEKIGH